MILCGKCKEQRPVFRVGASRTLKCVPCIAAGGSCKDRVALLLNAWDRFTAPAKQPTPPSASAPPLARSLIARPGFAFPAAPTSIRGLLAGVCAV